MKVPAAIDHLIIPIRLLILGGLVYAIYLAVRFFVWGTGDDETDLNSLEEFSMPSQVSVSKIINANLFGELPKEPVEQVIEETTLNLKLIGISYNAANPSMSRAYIVGRSKAKAQRIGVGERVEGVAEITEIFEDHVLLQRGGRKESLYVEQREQLIESTEGTTFIPEIPGLAEGLIAQADLASLEDTEDTQASTPEGWVRQYYDIYRERIDTEPEQVLAEMGISPVAEESAAGYFLHDAMAESLGLRTSDILLTVNGHRVGNVQDDLAQVANQLDAESLELEIQRGDTKITLNYTPNQ